MISVIVPCYNEQEVLPQLYDRLIADGYNIMLVDGPSSQTSDANGKSMVLISSTCASGDVNTKFRDVSVPVMVWEPYLFDDMEWTVPTGGTDYGTTAVQQDQLYVLDSAHYLADGNSDTITVASSTSIYTWGIPNSNAAQVASRSERQIIRLETPMGMCPGQRAMKGTRVPLSKTRYFQPRRSPAGRWPLASSTPS